MRDRHAKKLNPQSSVRAMHSSTKSTQNRHAVGPVLIAGELANKIITAIKKLNRNVEIQNQGSYLRVLVPLQCKLTKQAIQEQTCAPFVLPDDLELIMPSFKGTFSVSKDEASWSFSKAPRENK